MTRAPDIAQGAPGARDPITTALDAAVQRAKESDPLAPVTVVAPSAYAALFARRALGRASGPGGRRGVANVTCTTVDKLVRQLGVPVLAGRGLRPAPGPVDTEVIRTGASATGGWLAELVRHPRGLIALRDALAELRRCPASTLALLAGRGGRVGDLCSLLREVRAR